MISSYGSVVHLVAQRELIGASAAGVAEREEPDRIGAVCRGRRAKAGPLDEWRVVLDRVAVDRRRIESVDRRPHLLRVGSALGAVLRLGRDRLDRAPVGVGDDHTIACRRRGDPTDHRRGRRHVLEVRQTVHRRARRCPFATRRHEVVDRRSAACRMGRVAELGRSDRSALVHATCGEHTERREPRDPPVHERGI